MKSSGGEEQLSQRRIKTFCIKRRRGYTYVTTKLAIKEAKELFDQDGDKRYIYFCEKCDFVHFTSKEPTGLRKRNLNKKLIDYYEHWETFGKGTSKANYRAKTEPKKRARGRMPYMVWEDDGGAFFGER